MLSRLILSSSLFLLLAGPSPLFAQLVFQPADKPLFVPSLIVTGDDAFAGLSIVSIPGIPFTADVDVENRTISPTGTAIVHRLTGKIARDSHGRLRTVVDLNILGNPYDPTQVTIHIYNAPRKVEITLFPAASFAYQLFEDEEPRIARIFRPRLKQFSFKQLTGPSPELPHSESEDLGLVSLQGQTLRHGRETTAFPSTFTRDKKPFTAVMDYWFSQDLQVFVLVRRLGPNHSVQSVTLRNIRRGNPPRSVFQIPAGYRVETQHPDDSMSQGFCPLP